MRVTYVGHSTVVVDLDRTRIVTDPILRRRVAHLRREPVDPGAIGRPDAVLISHGHMDHLDPPSLNALGTDLRVVAPRGIARFLRGHDVIEVDVGDEVPVGNLRVIATQAEHDGRRYPLGPPAPALGYRICGSRSVFFAGDTGLFDGMRDIGATGIDVALLPVAGWGSRLPPGHLDPLAAAQALLHLRPAVAVPIHWGTLEPMVLGSGSRGRSVSAAAEFARHAAALAPDVEVVVVEPGRSIEL